MTADVAMRKGLLNFSNYGHQEIGHDGEVSVSNWHDISLMMIYTLSVW
jgi:hypothetical protein